MTRWLRLLWLALLLLLQACTSTNPSQRVKGVPIPGGSYSWGTAQGVEDFANVEIAQSRLLMHSANPGPWRPVSPRAIVRAQVLGLQTYYPMQARWRLKDGREFMLESVDQGALVHEYLKTHGLKLQWEREGRNSKVGDTDALLAHDIKDDVLRLKWVVTLNRTPINERLSAVGVAKAWKLEFEEHIVARIKGVATSGIDFAKTQTTRKEI